MPVKSPSFIGETDDEAGTWFQRIDEVSLISHFSLNIKQKEVSQQIKNLSNSVQMKRRSADTLRKRLNLTEAQIFDLDAAKEIAKQGKDNCERVNGVVTEETVELLRYWRREY